MTNLQHSGASTMYLYCVILLSRDRLRLDISHRIAANPDDAIDAAKQAADRNLPDSAPFTLLGMKALERGWVEDWVKVLGEEVAQQIL